MSTCQELEAQGIAGDDVTLAWYGLMLLVLPLRQPFWLMSVYPIVVLVLSIAIVHHLRRHGPRLRVAVAAALVGAFVWLGVGIARVYPTFEYYGYETVGDTWLGMPSRGYRSLVVVTNDGSPEALDWLREHAASAVVLSYLHDIAQGVVQAWRRRLDHVRD